MPLTLKTATSTTSRAGIISFTFSFIFRMALVAGLSVSTLSKTSAQEELLPV